ncbi:MAG: hypothetical protein FGM29_02465 [Actinobacteria bacterium]|nr:hypothetical protein [Actinomycetota bacterium]
MSEPDPATLFEVEELKHARSLEAAYVRDRSALALTALDNARDGAKQLVTAASIIVTLYVGALGAVFAVTDRPLPPRGIWAPVFLGICVTFASAYLAPLRRRSAAVRVAIVTGTSAQELDKHADNITTIADSMSQYNRRSVRAAIAALGIGVAFMAAPFMGADGNTSTGLPEPPALPTTAITGDASIVYGYQRQLYEQALCAAGRELEGLDCPKVESESAAPAWRIWEQSPEAVAGFLGVLGLLTVLTFAVWPAPRPKKK